MLSDLGLQKYLVRQREPQRYIRRHSSFYVGIHAHLWVDLFQIYSECVQELMQVNRHKLPNYLRGLRALIPSYVCLVAFMSPRQISDLSFFPIICSI